MSKYDKSIAISHEEEGTYQRRELDYGPRSPVATSTGTTTSYPVTTRYIERYEPGKPSSRQLAKQRAGTTSDSDSDNFQEWTSSKRKVNHKTRQVETRVSRQLLVRGGEVIADSGPQVTTRIKEDNKVEECEKERTPKNKGRFEALERAPETAEASGLVLGEKKEVQRVSREVREENMQYHDERFKELTGKDVHRRAIQAPHELITIHDRDHSASSKPRGKMIHYSNKGKKYQDTDEILEVAKLAIDGSVTKEVKRTKHHEEFSEDELPDEKGEAEQLRQKPVVERSSRRHADYVNDFDEADAPADYSSAVAPYASEAGSPVRSRKTAHTSSGSRARATREQEEAFPRYQIDPLLNSLRDEDFRPVSSGYERRAAKEHSIERNGAAHHRQRTATSSSDDDEQEAPARRPSRQRGRSPSASPVGRVEVPEEYRVNKQRLMSGKSGAGSTLSHKSNRSQQPARHREDAGTQARLSDEEVERQPMRSRSPSLHSHEKATRYLQRQSTPNSSRRYYYGDSQRHKQQAAARKRPTSLSSSSSDSSLSSELEEGARRKQPAQSHDPGFRSAPLNRSETPIYSKSGKHRSSGRAGAVSPTGSVGQRSVKTTTTTLSAGLADRPLSRQHKEGRKSGVRSESRASDKHDDQRFKRRQRKAPIGDADRQANELEDDKRSVVTITNPKPQAYDTISLSSLQGPNATKIKVPYQQIIEIERQRVSNQRASRPSTADKKAVEKTSISEMSLQEDIVSLSKRLASISDHNSTKQHFDYKTVVANLDVVPSAPQMVRSYDVKIQQQNSPFHTASEQPATEVDADQSSNSIHINKMHSTPLDNNNEPNFKPDHYTKYRATPALVDQSSQLSAEDDERMSQGSSCSLHSARTYNIRKVERSDKSDALHVGNKSDHFQENAAPLASEQLKQQSAKTEAEFDENGNGDGRATAWIFDPRDNSSTAIVAPPRPARPETPKVEAKTEELDQRRGGRSYYLELVEPEEKTPKRRPRPSSIDSLYSRWNSYGALHRPLSSVNARPSVSRKELSTASQSALAGGNHEKRSAARGPMKRRQLPFSGPPSSLGDRSKSSSCLLSVTKPSKYSIYGGFRKAGEASKPVPRLSYSRAIGPRSSRVDATPTAPSRYLKMR